MNVDYKPMPKMVVGTLVERGPQSSKLWTPGDEKKQGTLLLVDRVGPDVYEVQPGDTVVLHPEWVGAVLRLEDDETDELLELHVVHEDHLLMTVRNA